MERNNKAIRVNGGSKGHRKTYYIDDYGTNKNYRDFDREPRDKEPLYSKAYKALAELDMLKGSGSNKASRQRENMSYPEEALVNSKSSDTGRQAINRPKFNAQSRIARDLTEKNDVMEIRISPQSGRTVRRGAEVNFKRSDTTKDKISRPKFVAQSRIARTSPENNNDITVSYGNCEIGFKTYSESGKARPSSRGTRGKIRGNVDRSQFVYVKPPPLPSGNKKQIQEAMSKRYIPASKALDLTNFGADQAFGGSSGFIGKLTDQRVIDVVIETIGEHLTDLDALSLTNNSIKSLRGLSKIVDKAPNIKVLYLDYNKLTQCNELDNIQELKLCVLKLDGNPFLRDFKDGKDYSNQIRKKFKTLQVLDGNQLPKPILFEETDPAPNNTPIEILPAYSKMVVNENFDECIGRFLMEYFKVYDSENREQLAPAYHENAMMSMQAHFSIKPKDKNNLSIYLHESRNMNLQHIYMSKYKGQFLYRKRTQIIGFLDKLPKTQHDITSFTLDIPFATERLLTVSVTGAFRDRNDKPHPYPIRHFSRMFTLVPQGEGWCIVNDSLYITNAQKEQSERSNTLFILAQETLMNLEWTKRCLDGQGWNLEQARKVFLSAKQKNEIPMEAFS